MIEFKYDVPFKDCVHCDLETQSLHNISKVGAKAYLEHSSTRIMSGVFIHQDNCHVWVPKSRLPKWAIKYPEATGYKTHYHFDEMLPAAIKALHNTKVFVAHNAELFDAWAWEKLIGIPPKWMDTIHLCRAAGMPAGLDKALKCIGHEGKPDDAAMLLLTQAKAGPAGKPVYPVGTGALWEKLFKYNIGDVTGLKALHEQLSHRPVHHIKLLPVHCAINQRGFTVSLDRLRNLRELWAQLQIASKDEITEITKGELTGEDIGSPKKVKDWLTRMGFNLPCVRRKNGEYTQTLDKKVVDQILADPQKFIDEDMAEDDGQAIIAMLALRQTAVRATVGKLDRIREEADSNGVVNRWAVYHGAHTGRFSARGVQPHNFPRGVKLKGDKKGKHSLTWLIKQKTLTLSDVMNCAQTNNCEPADVLATMSRTIVVPRPGKKFIVYDFANIEARGIAWVARCNKMLELFRANEDVYCDMATKLFGRVITPADEYERFTGKQVVLACGYQVGPDKFGLMAKLFGVDLERAGVTPKDCVDAYRKGYPEIPLVWKEYNKAAIYAVKHPGNLYVAGRCRFLCSGGWLAIELPSKRRIYYRNARLINKPNPWNPSKYTDQVQYDNGYGIPKDLYGGKIAENIVQGLSFDILSEKIVEIESSFGCALHVHDEGLWEVDERIAEKALHTIGNTMSLPLSWSEGFPIGIEGHTASAWSKGKLSGESSANYLDGKLLAV